MNSPSSYNPLWKKIQSEPGKEHAFETTVPARIKKAITKRKHVLLCPGRLRFRTELKRMGGMVCTDKDENLIYILHVIYNLPKTAGVKHV